MPSSRCATVSSSLTRSSFVLHLLEGRAFVERFGERHVERGGMALATRSASAYGMSITRATSRTTARAFIVPNVMICATFSRPYLRGDVLDHFAAAALAEIDVDIRQRDALGIQEALENQVVRDRIDVGDAQAVGDEAAGGGAAAGADRNALFARVADEVPDDQEVPGYFICLIISIS